MLSVCTWLENQNQNDCAKYQGNKKQGKRDHIQTFFWVHLNFLDVKLLRDIYTVTSAAHWHNSFDHTSFSLGHTHGISDVPSGNTNPFTYAKKGKPFWTFILPKYSRKRQALKMQAYSKATCELKTNNILYREVQAPLSSAQGHSHTR